MTRKIEFRGQKTYSREWLYGYLYEREPDKLLSIDDWEIDSKTVGQFTGLLDKNNKKIFEGDILKTNANVDTKIGVCERSCFGEWVIKNGSFYQSIPDLLKNNWEIEIIGNKHENNNLLESNE